MKFPTVYFDCEVSVVLGRDGKLYNIEYWSIIEAWSVSEAGNAFYSSVTGEYYNAVR